MTFCAIISLVLLLVFAVFMTHKKTQLNTSSTTLERNTVSGTDFGSATKINDILYVTPQTSPALEIGEIRLENRVREGDKIVVTALVNLDTAENVTDGFWSPKDFTNKSGVELIFIAPDCNANNSCERSRKTVTLVFTIPVSALSPEFATDDNWRTFIAIQRSKGVEV